MKKLAATLLLVLSLNSMAIEPTAVQLEETKVSIVRSLKQLEKLKSTYEFEKLLIDQAKIMQREGLIEKAKQVMALTDSYDLDDIKAEVERVLEEESVNGIFAMIATIPNRYGNSGWAVAFNRINRRSDPGLMITYIVLSVLTLNDEEQASQY